MERSLPGGPVAYGCELSRLPSFDFETK